MPINNIVQHNALGNLPFTAKSHLIVHSLHAGEQTLIRKHWQQRSGVEIRKTEEARKGRHRGVSQRRDPKQQEDGSDRTLDMLA